MDVDIIVPPVDSAGDYTLLTGAAYGPDSAVWSYESSEPSSFYTAYEGGAVTLPNGDVLICQAIQGNIFEVDTNKNTVWDYVDPVSNGAAVVQGTSVLYNPVYRARLYSFTDSAFIGHPVSPATLIDRNPLASELACYLSTEGVARVVGQPDVRVYPNPAYSDLTVSSPVAVTSVSISNVLGQTVYSNNCNATDVTVDVSPLVAGVYFVTINHTIARRFVKD